MNSRGRQQVILHDCLRRCSDKNIPLCACQQCIRVQEARTEVIEKANDWSLPQLFKDGLQTSTSQDGTPTHDPDHPDTSPALLPSLTPASHDDGGKESRELPLLRCSSRRPIHPG